MGGVNLDTVEAGLFGTLHAFCKGNDDGFDLIGRECPRTTFQDRRWNGTWPNRFSQVVVRRDVSPSMAELRDNSAGIVPFPNSSDNAPHARDMRILVKTRLQRRDPSVRGYCNMTRDNEAHSALCQIVIEVCEFVRHKTVGCGSLICRRSDEPIL